MDRHPVLRRPSGWLSLAIGLALLLPPLAPQPVLASAPQNDDVADARTLTVPATGIAGTMVGATVEPDEPDPGWAMADTVWYRVTAPATTGLLVTVTRGSPRPVHGGVAVWRQGAAGLEPVVSDSEGYREADVWFPATAGSVYFLQVGHVAYGVAGGFGLSVVVNNDVPVTTRPVAGFTPMRSIWASGLVSLQVTWNERLRTSTPAVRVLEGRMDGGAWENRGVSAYKTVGWNVLPGHVYRFRVRIQDELGRWSSWAYSAPLTPAIVEQDDTSIRWSGRWRARLSEYASGGSLWSSTTTGAKATFTATGKALGFVSNRGPNRGRADIYVDGRWQSRIDLGLDTYQTPFVAWSRRWSTSAQHTITIVVRGTAGRPRVDVDAFVVLR